MGDQYGKNKPAVIKSIRELIWQKTGEEIRFFHVGLIEWGAWENVDAANTIFFSMNLKGDLQRVQKMFVYDYQFPIRYEKLDGVTAAKLSTELPEKIISQYYYVLQNQPLLTSVKVNTNDFIAIEFKKMPDSSILSPFKPNGCLRNFMQTGKFGLKK